MTTNVLYIAGFGRSGSSILGNVLAESHGVVHGGEIRNLWDDGLLWNRRCGCGTPFADCEFWRDVLKRIDREAGQPDADRIVWLRDRIARTRQAHKWARSGGASDDMIELAVWLGHAYAAIRDAAGASLVVDSTMSPVYGRALLDVDGLQVRVVHLVRDPRAVVNAWRRSSYQDRDDGVEMRRYGTASSASKWIIENRLSEALLEGRTPFLRVGYEEFAADPHRVVDRILDFCGVPLDSRPRFLDEKTITVGTHHTVWGNPSRFLTGDVRIRDDRRWVDELPASHQRLASLITAPWMRRYGYGRDVPAERTAA